MYHNQSKDPLIALIAILDKKNQPIMIKNYLVEQLLAEERLHIK